MHKVELLTRDGVAVAFDAEPAETLLKAAERAQIFLPSSCREGGCGACRVTAVAGDATLDSYSSAALSDEDRAAGDILLCRAHAHSDLSLKAPFDASAIAHAQTPARRARVVSITPAGASAVALRLAYDEDETGRAAQFVPGQYAELELPQTGVKRSYSLANTPNWDGSLEFLIRLHPGGAFSTWLTQSATPGDALVVHGPQGHFTLDEMSLAPRWFVAGGTGLAPVLSMLRQMAEFGETTPCRLFFGVNQKEELFGQEALEPLGVALPQLETTLCVWKPGASWTDFTGTPAQALAQALETTGERPDIYVCGPPALIGATERVAEAAGLPRDRVFSERFAPAVS